MEMPNIVTELYDKGSDVQYEIYAYRKLSEEEAIMAIRHMLANTKKKQRPKPGMKLQLHTLIGIND